MAQDSPSVPNQVRLLKVIADETRLRILGLLANQAHTGRELADALALSAPTVSHHMRKLTEVGIVTGTADGQRQIYTLNSRFLRDVRKEPREEADQAPVNDEDEFRKRTLRNFFEGDRLKSIPARRKQRLVVLQQLLERFDPSRTYSEREVNDVLRIAHEDIAILRRELVDYGYMVRDRGIYEVARSLPPRSPNVGQEVTGDEYAWLESLIRSSIQKAG